MALEGKGKFVPLPQEQVCGFGLGDQGWVQDRILTCPAAANITDILSWCRGGKCRRRESNRIERGKIGAARRHVRKGQGWIPLVVALPMPSSQPHHTSLGPRSFVPAN